MKIINGLLIGDYGAKIALHKNGELDASNTVKLTRIHRDKFRFINNGEGIILDYFDVMYGVNRSILVLGSDAIGNNVSMVIEDYRKQLNENLNSLNC